MWRICLDCRRAYDRDQANKHKERRRAYRKTYDATHKRQNTPEYKEKMRVRAKQDRDRFPERQKIANRKWRRNHPEKQAEAMRKWQIANKEKCKRNSHHRRSIERQLPSDFTEQDWQQCLEYFGYRCAVCGRPAGLWHTLAQDHWIPVTKGGGYTPGNIVPLCHNNNGCNNQKSNRDPMEWLISTYGIRKAKRIAKRIQEYFDKVRR